MIDNGCTIIARTKPDGCAQKHCSKELYCLIDCNGSDYRDYSPVCPANYKSECSVPVPEPESEGSFGFRNYQVSLAVIIGAFVAVMF